MVADLTAVVMDLTAVVMDLTAVVADSTAELFLFGIVGPKVQVDSISNKYTG